MNTTIIIQARMDSKRLPKKIMMKINGKPILQHIVEFLKFIKSQNQIIIATTKLKDDDVIQRLADSLKISCFRGETQDVLKRYYDCAKKFNADIIIRITGDNPLIDPTIVDETIKVCKNTKCDFVSNMLHPTYPSGYLVEAFSFNLLKQIHETQNDDFNKEHVGIPYLRKNYKKFNYQEIHAEKNLQRPNWRLTLDYKEDFELISKIFSKLYVSNSYIPYEKVIKFLDMHLDLLYINKKFNQ